MNVMLSHASNFVEALEAEVSRRSDEQGQTKERAFAEVVLDYLGYPEDEDYRREHFSDGPGDHGVDFWDVQENSATIYQFKTTDLELIDAGSSLAPSHLADVRRIFELLRNLDEIPATANACTTRFLTTLRSAIARHKENARGENAKFQIQITLASNAAAISPQAQGELAAIASADDLTNIPVHTSLRTLLLEDIIEERWREQNSDWRDKQGRKRDQVDIGVDGSVIESAKSLVFFARAFDIINMYEDFGYQIFEPNVRCEIKRSKVNEAIKNSIAAHRGRKEFRHLNNGVTIICASFQKVGKPVERIRIGQPGVINGLQTIKSMYDSFQELSTKDQQDFIDTCRVLVRLHRRDAVDDYRALVTSTNNQNPMQPRNLRANQHEQIMYERLFADIGWFYERKEGAWAAFKSDSHLWGTLKNKRPSDFMRGRLVKSVDNEELAQTWLAFLGYANEAVHERAAIFASAPGSSRDYYELIFLRRPRNHGATHNFKLDLKEVLADCTDGAPDPHLMLASYIAREFARQITPGARQHRDEAVKRLKLAGLPKDQQDQKLNEDNTYVEGLVLRAITYLFPEFLGYALFRAYGAEVHGVGRKLLSNGTFKRLFADADFKTVKEELEDGRLNVGEHDLLLVFWSLFRECLVKLVMSSWKQQWMMAPNRTRFNHSTSTREALIRELELLDDYVSSYELTRKWAAGLNKSKGVFRYVQEVLANGS